MTNLFVLIWMITYAGLGVTSGSQEFISLATCDLAKKEMEKEFTRHVVVVKGVCVPR